MIEGIVWFLVVILVVAGLLGARRSFRSAGANSSPLGTSRTSFQPAGANSAPLGTRWLKFWIYFSLPIGGVLDFQEVLEIYPTLVSSPAFSAVCTIVLVDIVMRVGLIFGLLCRKGWAWKWNWVFIALIWLCPTSQGFRSAEEFWGIYLTKIIGFGLVWMWPNYVYWKKRRGLFSGSSHRGKAPLMGQAEVSEIRPKAEDSI